MSEEEDNEERASQHAAAAYAFYRDVLGSPRFVVAPMVDASELPWRLLSKRYGAQLVYTPMMHAATFVRDARYRRHMLVTCAEDRPLIAQVRGDSSFSVAHILLTKIYIISSM